MTVGNCRHSEIKRVSIEQSGIVTPKPLPCAALRVVFRRHGSALVFRLSLSPRRHPARDLGVFAHHPELPRRGGFSRRARHRGVVRDLSPLGARIRAGHCAQASGASSQVPSQTAAGTSARCSFGSAASRCTFRSSVSGTVLSTHHPFGFARASRHKHGSDGAGRPRHYDLVRHSLIASDSFQAAFPR